MFFAVLVACLISSPTSCETYEMQLREWHPMMQAVEAQTWAAQFMEAHPGLRIVGGVRVVRGRSA